MNRILIFGNSGSGKSWLSREISKQENLSEINLDSIFWMPGGFSQKRSNEEVEIKINELKSLESWVVEGVFGGLVENFITEATEVIFLDFSWEECSENLLYRGSGSSKKLDPEVAEIKYKELLQWASEYWTRKSKSSHSFHNFLYESFKGRKQRITGREEVSSYLLFSNSTTGA
ncbi:AAA family ATPase [Endozoicomonas sp. OPT23]|nr:AAA family ATPase [Endozoicomonas sp. OPT23]